MRIVRITTTTVLAMAAVSVTACGGGALGGGKTTPDEFRVVAKPPLVVPPEYGLRPPAPGQPAAAELAPQSSARQVLLGQRQSVDRSPGEQALVAQAGAERADPLARYVVDDENGDLAHKDESFANRLMFWRRDDATTQAPTRVQRADGELVVDAASEAARLQALTGGRAVVIQRQSQRRFKLPGL